MLGVCHPADGPWSGRGLCSLRHSLVPHPRAPPPLPAPLPEVDSQDNPSFCTRAPDSAPLSARTSGAMAGRTGASTRGALAEFDLLGVFYVSVSRAETLGLSSLHCCLLISPPPSLLSSLCLGQKVRNKAQSVQWPRTKTWTQRPEASVQRLTWHHLLTRGLG